MRAVVIVLSVLGLFLPVGSGIVGYRRAKAEFDRRDNLLSRALEQLHAEDARAASDRASAILKPRATYGEITYVHEVTALMILRAQLEQLRLPAIVTGVGLACSTAASVLSVFLPPPT